jgi:hypothetical protein
LLSVLEVVLAVSLLALALRQWRRRNAKTAPPSLQPRIVRQLDHLTPRRASLLGVLIQPRTLTIAAAVVVARERSSLVGAVAGLGVFGLLSTGALLGLFTYFVRRPDGASRKLADIAEWIEQAAAQLLTIVLAIGGVYLLIDGMRGLSTR